MAWEIEGTDQFAEWYGGLTRGRRDRVDAAVERLAQYGPALGRPSVDTLSGSSIANLKELRPTRSIRILLAFDPRRSAILLIGGDKAGDWRGWYERMIPVAEALYEVYLAELRDEGLME